VARTSTWLVFLSFPFRQSFQICISLACQGTEGGEVLSEGVAVADELSLQGNREFVVQVVKSLGVRDLGFVGEMKKLGPELKEWLRLLHHQQLILVSSVPYEMRIAVDSAEILDHVFGRTKGICGTGFVPRVKVLLRIAFRTRINVIHAGFLILKMISVHL
jgi:hypothetical protein